MGDIIDLSKKKRTPEQKYYDECEKKGLNLGISYSDLTFINFYDKTVIEISKILSVKVTTDRERVLRRMNLIGLLVKIQAQLLVAIQTKPELLSKGFNLETTGEYLNKCYDMALTDYFEEGYNPFPLDDI